MGLSARSAKRESCVRWEVLGGTCSSRRLHVHVQHAHGGGNCSTMKGSGDGGRPITSLGASGSGPAGSGKPGGWRGWWVGSQSAGRAALRSGACGPAHTAGCVASALLRCHAPAASQTTNVSSAHHDQSRHISHRALDNPGSERRLIAAATHFHSASSGSMLTANGIRTNDPLPHGGVRVSDGKIWTK